MTVAVWDRSFGVPNTGDFSMQLPNNARVTSPDEGPPRVRMRRTLSSADVRWTLWMDADIKARFERWWRDDVRFGAMPFLAPDWTRDGWPLLDPSSVPLLDPSGTPILVACWRYYMASPTSRPEFRLVGDSVVFALTFPVMVMP